MKTQLARLITSLKKLARKAKWSISVLVKFPLFFELKITASHEEKKEDKPPS